MPPGVFIISTYFNLSLIISQYYNIRLWKVRWFFMIYIGIDIIKRNHFTRTMFYESKILFEPFQFVNGADGFCILAFGFDFLESDNNTIVL